MVRSLLFLAALVSLSACQTLASASDVATVAAPVIAHGPVVFADRTTADETAGRSVELAYKAARLLVETLVDSGVIHGARAAEFQTLNRKAYAAVQAARAAYRAGNADSIKKAVTEANAAIAGLTALAPGGQ
jgi:hypothetical protein